MTAELTAAERHVLVLLLAGNRIKQVANARGVAAVTVNRQLNIIRLKAGVRTLLQLGAWAERHGIREQGATP